MWTLAKHKSYRGPERRRHRVLVTLNSEYHCRDGECVAVRDRRTGNFVTTHPALGKHVTGGIELNKKGGIASATTGADPQPGQQVCFETGGDDEESVLTSPLTMIERPPKSVVAAYMH